MRLTKTYKFLVCAIFSLMLCSCEEQIDWNLDTEIPNTLVVDAIITDEHKHQFIRLTKPMSDPNNYIIPALGADVKIMAGNQMFFLFESQEYPGYYITESPVTASISYNYTLVIQYEEKEYRAESYMIPVLPANTPSFVLDNETGLYKINWNASQYDPQEQAMFEATISWDHLLPAGINDSAAYVKTVFYMLNTIDVSFNIFPQDKEELLFPAGSKAIVKKYSVTDEYGDFLRALLAETEWQGSLFEDAHGNLPGNISNGGLGYFSMCSVISDTLMVD